MTYSTSVQHTQINETYPMEKFEDQGRAQHYIYQQAYACVSSENGHIETSDDNNTIKRYNRKKELVSIFRVAAETDN